jgi:hypothetical protein
MTVATLRRFEILVYKNKNGTIDTAQVPADSTIEFYSQGATLKAGVSATSPATLYVWHLGTIKGPLSPNPGDTLWPKGLSTQPLVVTAVSETDPANLSLTVTFTGTLIMNAGERLIRRVPRIPDQRPQVYADPLGLTATGTSIQTTAAGGGRGSCYLREYRFDYVVSVTGEAAPRVFPDAIGSFEMR